MNKNQINDVGACFEKKFVAKNLPSLNYVSLLNNPGCPNELTQKVSCVFSCYCGDGGGGDTWWLLFLLLFC